MIKIKRLILICVILVTVITLNIFALFYLKTTTEETTDLLQKVTTKADMEKILDKWDVDKKRIGLFVHEEAVNEITDHLENCYSSYETKSFEVEIKKAVLSLQELCEKQLPTFYNIF